MAPFIAVLLCNAFFLREEIEYEARDNPAVPQPIREKRSPWLKCWWSGVRSKSRHLLRPCLPFSPIRKRSPAGWARRRRWSRSRVASTYVNVSGKDIARGHFTEVIPGPWSRLRLQLGRAQHDSAPNRA